jgi:hypothetical protein
MERKSAVMQTLTVFKELSSTQILGIDDINILASCIYS